MTSTGTTPKVTRYSMKVPLLTSGRTNQVLARTDTVEVRAKVYAAGGENALHTHLDEDHTFFVLDGEATFYGPDEETVVLATLDFERLRKMRHAQPCRSSISRLPIARGEVQQQRMQVHGRLLDQMGAERAALGAAQLSCQCPAASERSSQAAPRTGGFQWT